jgi:beta-glucosidase
MPLVDDSVQRLLIEKFQLGLFENPYVEATAAEKIVGNPEFIQAAHNAHQKSIVLLRNETLENAPVLPLKPKTKLYVEVAEQPIADLGAFKDLSLVSSPEEADVLLFWIVPKGKSLFQSKGQPISLRLSDNKVKVDRIKQLSAQKPTLLAINYTNPWVIDEIYSSTTPQVKGVLATFGTTLEALLDIVSGAASPKAKMPFSTPISEKAVDQQKADVPGFEEQEENYALFHYDEGMSF